MLRKKIKKKKLLFPIITTILIGSIAVFCNYDPIVNFALREESGEKDRRFTLKGKAFNVIEWKFVSSRTVSLIIIKEVTWNYINNLASQFGEYIKEQMLEDHYVSQGKYEDSGKFYVETQEYILFIFSSSGMIKYHIKYDPYSINLIGIFCICLGITTIIGIICTISQFKKLVKMKSNIEQDESRCDGHFKLSCIKCGACSDPDSIFCHECGTRLNNYR